MNNHEFCAHWMLEQNHGKNAFVLDYGCGAGETVKELRKQNIQAFGCDSFFDGGDYSKFVTPELFESGIIKRMDGNSVPFDDNVFDFVINNQVMEHVENLDIVLAEISRVLKPGGMVLSLFPDKGVWREGHCGIPFLHWFPKGSRPRVYYAAVCRFFGLGYHKKNKSYIQWAQDFCEWLDNWTYYRTQHEIDTTYNKYFSDIRHIEDYWLQLRLGRRTNITNWLPITLQRLVVRKLGGLVFVAIKPA
jgi:SAM-dependent methyltransferase